ncbi:unnamed protein product [Cunninghamella blakesleeana]
MTVIPTISITTPELESRDLEMNSPLTPNMPNSPTVFDFVKSMEDVPELHSDNELEDEEEDINKDQQRQPLPPDIIISDEPEELNYKTTSSNTTKKEEEAMITHDIKHFYKDKAIFITGSTGYIGKALLWKLLSTLHDDIDQIFLLIRMNVPHKRYSNPSTRLQDEILSNRAFVNLRRQLGATVFDQLIKDKVKAINGDLLEQNLGLSEKDYSMAVKYTNVIFHCAANTDWNEHLDLSVKANALGTNNILNFANECGNVSSFIHLSPLQLYGSTGLSYNTIGGLPNDDTVDDIISLILNTKSEELPNLFNQFKPYYPNTYLFSKSLAEHILIEDIQQKQRSKFQQIPIGIIRLSPVGPSVLEPLKGWADDVNGANGIILLTGRGTRVIDTGHGDVMADVIPVDYAVRTMISCAAIMKSPSNSFLLPKIDDIRPTPERTSSTPIEGTALRDSVSSSSSAITAPPTTTTTTTTSPKINTFNNNNTDKEIRTSSESNTTMNYFPYIYPISAANLHVITWKQAYEAIRFYWTRATGIQLPPSTSYFTVSAQGLSRARTMMNSIRSAASGYMNSNNATSTINSVSNDPRSRFTNKRGSHRITKYVDKAARIAPHVMKSYTIPIKRVSTATTTTTSSISTSSSNNINNNTINDSIHLLYKSPTMDQLLNLIQKDIKYNNHYNTSNHHNTNNNSNNNNNSEDEDDHSSNMDDNDDHSNMIFDPYYIIQENEIEPTQFWMEYFTNASFGMHYFVGNEGNTRLLIPKEGWHCALQFNERGGNNKSDAHFVIDHQVYSELFSPDQIQKRNTRMIDHLKHLLTQDEVQKPQDEHDWITDINDCLEDWCQDQTVANAEHDKRLVLGKWRKKVGSNDDTVKIVVLNDKRVNQAIHQITQNAGVSKQTAINEAIKILLRMSERTQLTYVWFVGSFLKSFFDNLFESIRVSEDSIRYIRQSILGKRVVYVPVSKSILDPLLVWFITIRYQLPVPALICDEVMTQLGPISDIYRLAGAYYVKRDKTQRSPLNSAVTAAYTQVLLREHGALSMCLEKSRTRTGKYQEAYDDELIEMIMESTLQSNQSRSSAAVTTNKVAAADMISPPDSPDSTAPSLTNNPTMSLDSTTGLPRKAHRDVVVVPINISYEDVPELSFLIDQVLDQQTRNAAIGMNGNMNHLGTGAGSKQSSLLLSTQSSSPSLPGVVRPSQAMDKRNRLLEGIDTPKKCGRVHFGIGRLVSVQDVANEFSKSNNNVDESVLANKIIGNVQQNQRDALVVTSISLVCAIVLYGRATGGVCLGKIKELLEWLKKETCERQYNIDWQDGEDVDSVIFSVFRLINENKNLIIEGKEMTDDTNIRVNDHADNIMALSYYSNQMVNVFLLDAFFAVIYLSFSEETVSEDDFMDRFRFLVQMLEKEFVLNWNVETVRNQFKAIMTTYEKSKVIRRNGPHQLSLAVKLETDPVRYEQLIFLASLIYPTIDTYWITSCSLSALECVPTLPRSIVPLLSQWIATHLITGRRTIYREVLSTESSRTAVDVFMSMGFLTEFQAKEKLSPDAQILLHELKIPTTETLIELTGQNSDGGMTPVSPNDPEGMMKALMAQIQMNRANSNMADLCQQIDSYRLGAASQRESFQNAQVFQKCLKQIKGILKVDISFAKKRNVELNEVEDGLVQLVHSLKVNSVSSNDSRALRRISQAYNLK